MAQGKVVFDGSPDKLTRQAVQSIYGDAGDADVEENLTSTLGAYPPIPAAAKLPEMADAL
jgi:phosphonate transport system ATP-binding protein